MNSSRFTVTFCHGEYDFLLYREGDHDFPRPKFRKLNVDYKQVKEFAENKLKAFGDLRISYRIGQDILKG
jgi:hypothetical protein